MPAELDFLPVLAVDHDGPRHHLATKSTSCRPSPRGDVPVRRHPGDRPDRRPGWMLRLLDPPAAPRDGISNPRQWSPALSPVLALGTDARSRRSKVAPGINHTALPSDSHTQWVSVDGDVNGGGLHLVRSLAPEGPRRSAGPASGGEWHHRPHNGRRDVCRSLPNRRFRSRSITSPDLGSIITCPTARRIRRARRPPLPDAVRPAGGPRIGYLVRRTCPTRRPRPSFVPFQLTEVLPLRLQTLRADPQTEAVRESGIPRSESRCLTPMRCAPH